MKLRPPHLAGAMALALALLIPGLVSAQSDDDSQTSAPPPVDPCQLVTSAEASALAGTTYGDGTYLDNNTCVYGSQTMNVFMVTATQASDADTANALWSEEEAKVQTQLQSNIPGGAALDWNVNDTSAPGADRAATLQGSVTVLGRTISASGFYLLKGPDFVGFSDLQLGSGAPTSDAMSAQAATIVSRLP